ncbi:MAG: diguanylate cyclase [Nitrospiraceae bacterium]|nr:diguanylate cyclase [Nitrospiraceae bacterium]
MGFFFPLSITRKILLGYLSMAVLIVIISVYALTNLDHLNGLTRSILTRDVELVDISEKLIGNVLAHELYARRYAILRTSDMLSLYRERSREFDELIEKIRRIPQNGGIRVDRLVTLHNEYNDLFNRSIPYLKDPASGAARRFQEAMKKKQEELVVQINGISLGSRKAMNEKMLMTARIGDNAFRVASVLCISGIALGAFAALWITRNISGSIHRLKDATMQISQGKFEYRSEIRNHDELGDLSSAFSEMAKRLKRLETMYLDASPLTRLPGGVAIENVVRKRIASNEPFAFCLIDMDNFKAFNDRYGYAMGSEVIKATARIIESVIAESGAEEDFLGHIGGDDFAVITTPERYPQIAESVIERFDGKIGDFYSPEDRASGYIVSKNRQGEEMTFPLMTISIAVVTNQNRVLTDPLQVGEIAAELKEHAKSIPKSIYVVDQRKTEHEGQEATPIPFPERGGGA